jgi:hypothetical protein
VAEATDQVLEEVRRRLDDNEATRAKTSEELKIRGEAVASVVNEWALKRRADRATQAAAQAAAFLSDAHRAQVVLEVTIDRGVPSTVGQGCGRGADWGAERPRERLCAPGRQPGAQ